MGMGQKYSSLSKEEIQKLREKRLKIVTELVETEKVYVKALQDLETKWETPIRKSLTKKKPPVTEEEIRGIFSNAQVVLKIHEGILEALQEKVKSFDDKTMISDVFIQNAQVLKLYTDYINNYNNSIMTLNKCAQSKDFMELIKDSCGAENTMGLSSLLIQPIQRLPRYVMLLEEIIKNTWDIHPDLEPLNQAFAQIKQIANYINEQKREFENAQTLSDLQSKFGKKIVLITPTRKIISKTAMDLKVKDKTNSVWCLLMTDAILVWDDKPKKAELIAFGVIHSDITLNLDSTNIVLEQGKSSYELIITEKGVTRAAWVEQWTKATLALQKAGPAKSPEKLPSKTLETPKTTPSKKDEKGDKSPKTPKKDEKDKKDDKKDKNDKDKKDKDKDEKKDKDKKDKDKKK